MKRLIERSFEISASLADAWNHFAQVEKWPSWARHIRKVELHPTGELGPHTHGRLHLRNGMKSEFSMTSYEPHMSWQWSGPFLWMHIDYDHRFRVVDERTTEMTFVVEGSGFGINFFGPIFATIYNRNLDRAIPNLIAEMNGL